MLAQLIKQHQQQPDFTESVHDIIMEETDNGRTIVEFLLSRHERRQALHPEETSKNATAWKPQDSSTNVRTLHRKRQGS